MARIPLKSCKSSRKKKVARRASRKINKKSRKSGSRRKSRKSGSRRKSRKSRKSGSRRKSRKSRKSTGRSVRNLQRTKRPIKLNKKIASSRRKRSIRGGMLKHPVIRQFEKHFDYRVVPKGFPGFGDIPQIIGDMSNSDRHLKDIFRQIIRLIPAIDYNDLIKFFSGITALDCYENHNGITLINNRGDRLLLPTNGKLLYKYQKIIAKIYPFLDGLNVFNYSSRYADETEFSMFDKGNPTVIQMELTSMNGVKKQFLGSVMLIILEYVPDDENIKEFPESLEILKLPEDQVEDEEMDIEAYGKKIGATIELYE